MRPINGLYVLRLDLPSQQQPSPTASSAATSKPSLTTEEPTSASASASATAGPSSTQKPKSSTSPAVFLNSCRLLCRLRFDGVRGGSISGSVKLVIVEPTENTTALSTSTSTTAAPTKKDEHKNPSTGKPSGLTTSSSSSANRNLSNNNNNSNNNSSNNNNNNNNNSNVRASLATDGTWILDNAVSSLADGGYDPSAYFNGGVIDTEGVMNIDFGVTLDRLDGVLLQVANSLANEINNSSSSSSSSSSADSMSSASPPHSLPSSKVDVAQKQSVKNAKIHLRFTGPLCGGQGVGRAQVSTGASGAEQISVINNKNESGATVTQELRMILTEVVADRCSCCGDPIDLKSIGTLPLDSWKTVFSSSSPSSSPFTLLSSSAASASSSSSSCAPFRHPESPDCLVYCSEQCKSEHEHVATILIPHLAPYSTPKASRCVAAFAGREFTVFWRSVTATTFLVLVEPRNPYHVCYEILLDVLIDARQGLKINVINHDQNEKSVRVNSAMRQDAGGRYDGEDDYNHLTSELINLNVAVYESVIRSAIANGCVALAAACLNQLHVWCDYAAYLERQFLNFYDLCIGGGWDGLRLVSTLGEYVMIARPMFECASVLIEAALKSTLANDFWYRLENAKGVLISLYNINGSVSFTPAVQHLRSTIVPEQQRETLLLLAKVFLIMAARSPEDQAQKMLNRAEECYTDAIEEDRLRHNLRRMALTTLNMSALCTLIKGAETKGAQLRTQGIALLQSVTASPTAHRQLQQHCTSTIISTIGTSDELGVGVVDK